MASVPSRRRSHSRLSTWSVERLVGRAAELHARPFPTDGGPRVTLLEVTRPAIVLGSSQSDKIVDMSRMAGVDLARRRGGGGAVWLDRATALWFEVFVPIDHERWDHDVSRASWWLGDAVVAAMTTCASVTPRPAVHRDTFARGPGSDAVCFAGLGSGEVSVAGRKLVGWSQRRTRLGARFMGVAYRGWDPAQLVARLGPTDEWRAALAAEVRYSGVGLDELDLEGDSFIDAFVEAATSAT